MKITAEVKVYERNGVETKLGDVETIQVDSHWNIRDFVVLTVSGNKVTVAADQLRQAVDRCSGWR